MICSSCKKKLKKTDIFCPNCGEKHPIEAGPTVEWRENNDEVVSAFVTGSIAPANIYSKKFVYYKDSFVNGKKWSWVSFFFPGVTLLYRKCYVASFFYTLFFEFFYLFYRALFNNIWIPLIFYFFYCYMMGRDSNEVIRKRYCKLVRDADKLTTDDFNLKKMFVAERGGVSLGFVYSF